MWLLAVGRVGAQAGRVGRKENGLLRRLLLLLLCLLPLLHLLLLHLLPLNLVLLHLHLLLFLRAHCLPRLLRLLSFLPHLIAADCLGVHPRLFPQQLPRH